MTLANPAHRIPRKQIAGMENIWTKMWDPPRASPATPELMAPTNPVPAFMAQQLPGAFSVSVANTVQRQLLSGLTLGTWDGLKILDFMTFRDTDGDNSGHYPAPTIRVPRGVIYHGQTQGSGPPPHTIHWHGIEPTPMNDGVGHCSMEIGQYTYQWQPNFIGTYFYHCHRNTVQHFEFGLFGMLLIEPPDAFSGPNAGGYPRRTAANLPLLSFPQFADKFTGGDPVNGVGNAANTDVGDLHAFTVEYDVEALWVLDDRDSVWSDLASNAKSFYPGGSSTQDGPDALLLPVRPGVDDQFPKGFFHDFNADYWFVTGVPVPAARGGVGTIDPAGAAPTGGGLPGGLIPALLNSGVAGMQVAINAQVNQVILVRILDAAYNSVEISFPMDVVIIAYDGRALGVPPFARYNHAFTLPANTPHRLSTARRFDVLIRSLTAINSFAEVKFFETRGLNVLATDPLLVTARIPIVISA
jgi:hypothetical protein